jgi:hypothetical protein
VPNRTWSATALALLVTFAAATAASTSGAPSAQGDDLRAFDGDWLYVEDRTEGRAPAEQQPPMSVTFALRVDEDAVVLLRGKGTERREERIALDGPTAEVAGDGKTTRSRGAWKDGAFPVDVEVVRASDGSLLSRIRREFRVTSDGLLVRVVVGDPVMLESVAPYRHPEDIPLPAPAEAAMADVAWLAGARVGTRGTASIEERWSPALGGAMLGVSRTVSGGAMVAFEYLRVVERGGGLVYVAQPGGAPPTEFVLTELGATRAVFENPRHDSPQRIAYELSAEGVLTASIGFAKGGNPQRFEFRREGQ